MPSRSKAAVLGGGNGGFAAAAHLTLCGCEVSLYNRSAATIAAVAAAGGITYQGVLGEGFARVSATTDMAVAVDGAALIEVCAPALAHPGYAAALAPLLQPETLIVLNPGDMLGSLAFVQALRTAGYTGAVRIGETSTLTYICRKPDDGSVNITASLQQVPFAAFPGQATAAMVEALQGYNLDLAPETSVLPVGLANVNIVLHPTGMVLAAAWIEHSGGDFAYYYDAATPAVARTMEALDRERLAVAQAYGVVALPFPTLFANIGSTSRAAAASGSYLQALLDSVPNRQLKAPPRLDHRYLNEDVPCSLVPLAELGAVAGVPMPVTESLITLAGTVNATDYRAAGRRLAALGLGGRDRAALLRYLSEGL